MEKSQNPDSHGISGEDDDDWRSTDGSSQNREPSSPERIETERMSKDETRKIKKVENNREYRKRKKSKMETLEAANRKLEAKTADIMGAYGLVKGKNCQLRSQIKCLKQEMQLLNQRLETQSKELGGLRKTCDRLEEKNAEEHERNRQLESKVKKWKTKFGNVNGKYVQLLEQCKVNPTFESRSNEMPQQFVAPQVQSARVAPENYTPLWENNISSWLPEPEDYRQMQAALENHTQMQVAEDYPPMQVAPGNNTT